MTRNRFRIQHGARIALALLVSSLATLSCSFIVNDTSTKQCSVDSDCPKLGGSFAKTVCQQNVCVSSDAIACSADVDCTAHGADFANYLCQQNVCVASDPFNCTMVPQTSPTVKLTFPIGFLVKPSGNQGTFTVVACARADLECANPVAGPATEDPTDPSAFISLDVPYGFQGYLQIKNDGVTVPAMEFLARPLQRDTQGWALTLATLSSINQLGIFVGTPIDPTLGLIISIMRDCNRAPQAGVQATITQDASDAGAGTTVPFIFANMFPNTKLMATTDEGAAGFANVPPGPIALSGINQMTGFQYQATPATSRAGWLSYVEVQP